MRKKVFLKLNFLSKGQTMILTVLSLGGTMLGATTIAGLLMLYQLRQATDMASSAKAIFAADAGIEWAIYCLLNSDDAKCPPPSSNNPLVLDDNVTNFFSSCYGEGNVYLSCVAGEPVVLLRSLASSRGVYRALEVSFELAQ